MKTKHCRKLLSLAVCLALILTTAIGVFADENQTAVNRNGAVKTLSGGVVTLYESVNYQGQKASFNVGEFSFQELKAAGLKNNKISSIKVASGYKAILYSKNNFKGEFIEKTINDDTLADDNFCKSVSSLKVVKLAEPLNIYDVNINSIGATYVELECKTSVDGAVTLLYGVDSASLAPAGPKTEIGRVHAFSIDCLTPQTTYWYKLAVKDIYGNEAESDLYTFSTMEGSIEAPNTLSLGEHVAFLKSDGTVTEWGRNDFGQCDVPEGLNNVISIETTAFTTVVLEEDGSVVEWGLTGTTGVKEVPAPTAITGVKAISAGGRITAALKNDGSIVAWGDNEYGACDIPADLKDVKAISAGGLQIAALKYDGTVVMWGNNDYGQCDVPAGLTRVKAVETNGYNTAAIKEDGSVVVWGDNTYGQCTPPAGLGDVRQISVGLYHISALKNDGTIVVWGNNFVHQCDVPEGLSDIKTIVAGGYNTAAIREDGTYVIWGDNQYGQCDGENTLPPPNDNMLKNVSIDKISYTYMRVSFDFDGRSLNSPKLVKVFYGTAPSELTEVASEMGVEPVETQGYIGEINSLTPNTTYYFAFALCDEFDPMDSKIISDTYTFSTLQAPESKPDDCGNTINDAVEMPMNEEFIGSVDYLGDIDYFRFVAGQEGTCYIYSSGDTPIYVHLTDSRGYYLASGHNVNGNGLLIEYPLETGETYYLRVMHADEGVGEYGLKIMQ